MGGGILLLLGLAAFSVLPITWSGIAPLLLAIGFFAAEAFVTSHGVLGVGGAIALVLGALLLVDGPPELRISFWTAIGVGLPFAVIACSWITCSEGARAESLDRDERDDRQNR